MAVCKFSIVRYVPDPVRGEQLNVGVVLGCESPRFFRARFLAPQQSGRLRSIGFDEDFGFLRDLDREFRVSALSEARLPLEGLEGPWTLGAVERAAHEWANTIQFAELRAAVHDEPGALLDVLYERYVAPVRRREKTERDRRWIKSKVSRTLRQTVLEVAPTRNPAEVVQSNSRVSGAFEEHTFDYGLVNGRLFHLVQTLSFAVRDRDALRTEVDATSWALDDLKRAGNRIPVSVVTAGDGRLLEGARRIYEAFDAQVVREDGIDEWLNAVSAEIAQVLD